MKTRIISGAVIVLLSAAVLGLSLNFPIILSVAFALLGCIAVYEALYSTAIVKNRLIVGIGCLLAAFVPFVFCGVIDIPVSIVYSGFAVLQFALYLKFHKEIALDGMMGMILLPILISYAFSSFCLLAGAGEVKLLYVILVLCWSAISDTGAYFTGVALGKHKMAPVISPKKSWEGLIGGMVFSLIAVFLVCLLYTNTLGVRVNMLSALLVTPLFVLVGVLGDLTASLIKRKCGIKDFGKLIPGHGGILDRFDSILMISPLFALILNYISIIK